MTRHEAVHAPDVVGQPVFGEQSYWPQWMLLNQMRRSHRPSQEGGVGRSSGQRRPHERNSERRKKSKRSIRSGWKRRGRSAGESARRAPRALSLKPATGLAATSTQRGGAARSCPSASEGIKASSGRHCTRRLPRRLTKGHFKEQAVADEQAMGNTPCTHPGWRATAVKRLGATCCKPPHRKTVKSGPLVQSTSESIMFKTLLRHKIM